MLRSRVVIALGDEGPQQPGGGDGGITALRGGPTLVVPQEQLGGLIGMSEGEVSGSDFRGDVGAAGVNGVIVGNRVDVGKVEGVGGVLAKRHVVVIGQRGRRLLCDFVLPRRSGNRKRFSDRFFRPYMGGTPDFGRPA